MTLNASFSRSAVLRIGAILALAMPIGGCLLMKYQSPTDGPLADVVIHNGTARVMSVHLYGDSRECRERQTLMPITKPFQTREIRISTLRDATITLAGDTGISSGCIATFTFTPIEGRRYDATFRQVVGGCTVRLLDVTADGAGRPHVIRFRKREWKTAFDEHGPFCDAQ